MAVQDFPLSIECEWRERDVTGIPDPVLSSWLFEAGSLTARLKSHCERFDVEVINQIRQPVTASQRTLLNTQADFIYNREVLLICDGHPMVYAQSWIPDGAEVAGLALDKLGSKPLGEVIFTEKKLIRQTIEVARFSVEDDVVKFIHSLNLPEQPLWGRRSVFSLQRENILVCEIFLPGSYPCL